MSDKRQQLIELIERGAIVPGRIAEALAIARIYPRPGAWKAFLEYLLLGIGTLALGSAVVFFIAYNWEAMGRFAKFGLVEVLMLLAIAAYWWLGAERLTAKFSLMLAAILLGVLLALYGQTYQTGADPWQLFCNWALLLLPWALIGRFALLWILWLALINLSLLLYYQVAPGLLWFAFDSELDMIWLLFVLNGIALVVWELLSLRRDWLDQRWAVRLIAVVSGVCITWLALHGILEDDASIVPVVVWLVWLAAIFYGYYQWRCDLFMLASACLSAIVVATAFFGRHLFDDVEPGSFLIMSLLVIAMGSGAALWLRRVHREWQT